MVIYCHAVGAHVQLRPPLGRRRSRDLCSDGSKVSRSRCFLAVMACLFSFKIFCEKTVDFSSHQIFRYMHEALNIDKK
jgi:hypothetical protein